MDKLKQPEPEERQGSKRLLPLRSIMEWEPDDRLKQHINHCLGLDNFESEMDAVNKEDE